MSKKKILVTGGAGFIGSHINKMLDDAGYDTVVFDNLSRGDQRSVVRGEFVKGDIGFDEDMEKLFAKHRFDAVMHFAAFIDVGESVRDPAKYYINNVANTLKLLEHMRKNHVDTIIFSSTAALYGMPKKTVITEDDVISPINPYGESKWMMEKILRDYGNAYGLKWCCLRYFNAAGGDPSGEIRNFKKQESNLIPVVLRSLLAKNGIVHIFGTDYPTFDGTCIRDYIHIFDLGMAHIAAMERLFAGGASSVYNLGNGHGFSVLEVIKKVEVVTGLTVNKQNDPRRPGDSPILIADSTKACKELNWHPKFPDLDVIISHAWNALKIPQPDCR